MWSPKGRAFARARARSDTPPRSGFSPTRGGIRMPRSLACACDLLSDHHPCRLQQGIRDQANHRRHGNEKRVADLPTEENGERDKADEGREPVANGNATEQHAGSEYGPDRGCEGSPDEAFDVRVGAVAQQERGGY